jgi:hypothetical protein
VARGAESCTRICCDVTGHILTSYSLKKRRSLINSGRSARRNGRSRNFNGSRRRKRARNESRKWTGCMQHRLLAVDQTPVKWKTIYWERSESTRFSLQTRMQRYVYISLLLYALVTVHLRSALPTRTLLQCKMPILSETSPQRFAKTPSLRSCSNSKQLCRL